MLSNLELLCRCQKPLMEESRQAGSVLHKLMLVHILRAVPSIIEAISLIEVALEGRHS